MKYEITELTKWIQQQVISAGCNGTVVGMSGGIDSSIVSVLCKKAFASNVLGVIMPCYSSPTDVEHALLVGKFFDIPTYSIDLSDVWLLLGKKLQYDSQNRIPQANIKSRLRMVVLYYFANLLNYLVVGTSNKSELALGYFTKYGDGGVDIEPLGNIFKTEEYELARKLGIPECIINKPPSPGLWEGHKTEDEIGLSYNKIDDYLGGGFLPAMDAKKLDTLVKRNSHKLSAPAMP